VTNLCKRLCDVQDIFDRAVADADAEMLPVDPPREDWLVHKVCFDIFCFINQCKSVWCTFHSIFDCVDLQELTVSPVAVSLCLR